MNTSVKKETVAPNSTSDSSLRSWAEPSPNWLEAIKEWSWLWEVHIYGFGTIFVLITLFAVFYLVYSRKTTFSRQRVHLAVMNIALFTAGFLRALILFWDPYASSSDTTDLQLLFCIISWGISTACITSSFSIMLLIFLETTTISLGPARLKNLPCLDIHNCSKYRLLDNFWFSGVVPSSQLREWSSFVTLHSRFGG